MTEALAHATDALLADGDLFVRAQSAIAQFSDTLPVSKAVIGLRDPVGGAVEVHTLLPSDAGIEYWQQDDRELRGKGPSVAMRTGKPRCEPIHLGLDPAQATVHLPLKAGATTCGFLSLTGLFQRDHLDCLLALANCISLALRGGGTSSRSDTRKGLQKELDDFVYAVSHDVGAPARQIIGFGDLLREQLGQPLDADGRFFLETILDGAARMNEMMTDLVAFTRLRAPHWETVDMNEVASQALDLLTGDIDEAGATIEIAELPTIRADGSQMRQLLRNLLANSLRYRGERSLHVSIESTIVEDGCTWRLAVRDNGNGFDARYVEKMFKPFGVLHPVGAFPGTGMGLPTCKRIVERHGGTISAVGDPGQSACFTIDLPLDASLAEDAT